MNTKVQRDISIQKLREAITPGATIYVLLRHKNKLGTCRWIEFYHIHDGQLKCITWDVSLVIQGEYCREHDAVKTTGVGLDVGYASVRDLSDVLGRTLTHKWL